MIVGSTSTPALRAKRELASGIAQGLGDKRPRCWSPLRCKTSLVIDPAICGNVTVIPKTSVFEVRSALNGKRRKIDAEDKIALMLGGNWRKITAKLNITAVRNTRVW